MNNKQTPDDLTPAENEALKSVVAALKAISKTKHFYGIVTSFAATVGSITVLVLLYLVFDIRDTLNEVGPLGQKIEKLETQLRPIETIAATIADVPKDLKTIQTDLTASKVDIGKLQVTLAPIEKINQIDGIIGKQDAISERVAALEKAIESQTSSIQSLFDLSTQQKQTVDKVAAKFMKDARNGSFILLSTRLEITSSTDEKSSTTTVLRGALPQQFNASSVVTSIEISPPLTLPYAAEASISQDGYGVEVRLSTVKPINEDLTATITIVPL